MADNRTQSDYSPAKLSREPQETHEITGLFIFSGAGDDVANVVGSRHVCSRVPHRRQLKNASFVDAAAATAKPICIVFSLLMRQPQTTQTPFRSAHSLACHCRRYLLQASKHSTVFIDRLVIQCISTFCLLTNAYSTHEPMKKSKIKNLLHTICVISNLIIPRTNCENYAPWMT